MMRPRDPAKQSFGRRMKRNECKSKPLAKWSGQAMQQSSDLGDQLKEMKANLWHNDAAKGSSKAIIWETNEKKWMQKQTFGKMIRPSHAAKQWFGRPIKRNESKPLAQWCGQGIQQSNHLGDIRPRHPAQPFGLALLIGVSHRWTCLGNYGPKTSREQKEPRPTESRREKM